METARHKYLRWIFTLLLTGVGCFLAAFVLPKLLGFFFPFVVGWIVAIISEKPIRLMKKKLKITQKFGSAVFIVLFLALILGLLYAISNALVGELLALLPKLPGYVTQVLAALERILNWFSELLVHLPGIENLSVDQLIDPLEKLLVEWVSSSGSLISGSITSIALSLPKLFFYSIITIVCSFLLVVERAKLKLWLNRHCPAAIKEMLSFGKKSLKKAVNGYFVAQLKMAWIVALILLVGFLLMRIPYALLLSLLIAFVDLLPVFGSGTILLPWAVVMLFDKNYVVTVVLLVLYALTQGIKQILGPKLMGETMGLHPLVTLLFLYVGFRFYGIGGMIFAVPVGMVFLEICRYGVFDPAVSCIKEMIAEVSALVRNPKKIEETEDEAGEDEFAVTSSDTEELPVQAIAELRRRVMKKK